MPTRTYMEVDPRHDHSIRVPRPDLARFGIPNACASCHTNRTAEWATEQLHRHGRDSVRGFQDFTDAFLLDDQRSPGAVPALTRVADSAAEPAIVRASALVRLGAYPDQTAVGARHAQDASPLVRLAVLHLLESSAPEQRIPIAGPMLSDSLRSIRIEAAWVLSPVAKVLSSQAATAFATAAREFVESQRYNTDRAGNRTLLGAFYTNVGHLDSAAAEFNAAIKLSPSASRAYLGLAAVLEAQGRASDATQAVERGLAANPTDADLAAARAALSRKKR